MIKIQRLSAGIEKDLWEVFYSAVRFSCSKDYSLEQVRVWAPDEFDGSAWVTRIQTMNPYVAKIDSKIIGYADLQANGYIDHFYVHHQYQGQGVGKALMHYILKNGQNVKNFFSHVSITARPFFESQGFTVVDEQIVKIQGIEFLNYLMELNQHDKR